MKLLEVIYLMTCTRPDLCYVVTYLSQHLSKPMKSHYGKAKQVLRYLKGTYNRFVKFVKGPQLKLVDIVGYCAPEAQANSHLNTARSWRDDERQCRHNWAPASRPMDLKELLQARQSGLLTL